MSKRPIYVTRPSLAPLDDFVEYLKVIWETGVMTHNGPLMQRLEKDLSNYLNVPDTICVANGTNALQLSLRALDIEGEVITTPFSFIATANIIRWERCTPIFVDIDPETWNIDTNKIEAAITARTTAIMPVHVFSAPCDCVRIQEIADEYSLRVIYDGAHAMGVTHKNRSIFTYGDISTASFHATKIFNTAEGGACFTGDSALAARIRRLRFFGFNEAKEIVDNGMNAKMTEVSAALGLANLKMLDEVIIDRRHKYQLYKELLSKLSCLNFQKITPGEYNYSYMPVTFDTEQQLLGAEKRLNYHQIFPRRYFHPSLNEVFPSSTPDKLDASESVARRILCLPMFYGLSESDIIKICDLLYG